MIIPFKNEIYYEKNEYEKEIPEKIIYGIDMYCNQKK